MTVPTVDLLRSWTEADLDNLPDYVWRSEIIDGRLQVQAPAGESHQSATIGLLEQLRDHAPTGWRVRFGIGLAIGDNRVVPDLIVLPPETPMANAAYNDVAVIKPHLVIEIASRSTEIHDAGDKMIIYANAGIPAYWRVARNGKMFLHTLADAGVYALAATVAPGEQHGVRFPFPLALQAPE